MTKEIKFFHFANENIILVGNDPLGDAAQKALNKIKSPREGVYLKFLKRLEPRTQIVGIWVTNNAGGQTGWSSGYWQTCLNLEDELIGLYTLTEKAIKAAIRNKICREKAKQGQNVDLSETKFWFLCPAKKFESFRQKNNRLYRKTSTDQLTPTSPPIRARRKL